MSILTCPRAAIPDTLTLPGLAGRGRGVSTCLRDAHAVSAETGTARVSVTVLLPERRPQ